MNEYTRTDTTNNGTTSDQNQQTVRTGHRGTDQFLDAISRVQPFCAADRLQPNG